MKRARESLSDRERDVSRFLSELHRRTGGSAGAGGELRRKQAELAAREKELAREWEKRESAKLKELERRTDQVLAKFEEQAQETIGRIAQKREQRKAADHAQRDVSKVKRELREEFQTTVLSTQNEARHGRTAAAARRRGRAGPPAATSARPARVRRKPERRPHRGGSRLHEDAGARSTMCSRCCPKAGGAIEAAEERDLQAGAGAGARAPGDQRDRPARRRGARRASTSSWTAP